MASQRIEQFRAEVRRRRFCPLIDAELADVKRRVSNAHHSNRIEGIVPDADTEAMFEVLLSERVPAEEWAGLVLGFSRAARAAA